MNWRSGAPEPQIVNGVPAVPPITIIGPLVTIIGIPITIIGPLVTIIGIPITIIGALVTIRGIPITIIGPRSAATVPPQGADRGKRSGSAR